MCVRQTVSLKFPFHRVSVHLSLLFEVYLNFADLSFERSVCVHIYVYACVCGWVGVCIM